MANKKKKGIKKIKAWAIFEKDFNVNLIFRTKRLAQLNTKRSVMKWKTDEKIIPITITYSP